MPNRLNRLAFAPTFLLLVAGSAMSTLFTAQTLPAAAMDEPYATLGQRIYRHGILPTGEPLRARVQTDVNVEGAQLVCQNCHGRSGLGQGEGTIFMPAVTGASLYEPREIRNGDFHVSRLVRPAYTDATLARAIRSGLDPNGRVLDDMMPRYALDDNSLRALGAYLKTLSSGYSPGVTGTEIHFATVISEDVPAGKRAAVLDVLKTFFEKKNAGTRLETRRTMNAPAYKQWHYEAYRKWVLHVWELGGPQGSWWSQLEALYERQPVFAMISGITSGPWKPVHEFCERREIPCLLPNTDLPVISEHDYYSVYFSKGMTVEAEALARHLVEVAPSQAIVQVYRDDVRGTAAATALRRAVDGNDGVQLRDRRVAGDEAMRDGFWKKLPHVDPATWLVLWLSGDDLPSFDTSADWTDGWGRIYVSSSMLGDRLGSIPNDLRDKVYMINRFDLPADAERRRRGATAWLRRNGIESNNPRLQMNALFTTTLVAQALKHVGSNFYRDYFLERVEHILDGMVMPSAYPKLTLAPNQRFASKGCYIVPVARDGSRDAEWVVP